MDPMRTRRSFHPSRHRWRELAEAALLFLLALTLHSGGRAVRTQSHLADRVVRLHVLANSDNAADQALKLRVRDRILQETAPLLSSCAVRSDAERVLSAALADLAHAGAETVAESGFSYDVSVELGEADFPTRRYDGFSLPAGRYLALRVILGQGAGKNWWCILFPPLCAAPVEPAGTVRPAEQTESGVSDAVSETVPFAGQTRTAASPKAAQSASPAGQTRTAPSMQTAEPLNPAEKAQTAFYREQDPASTPPDSPSTPADPDKFFPVSQEEIHLPVRQNRYGSPAAHTEKPQSASPDPLLPPENSRSLRAVFSPEQVRILTAYGEADQPIVCEEESGMDQGNRPPDHQRRYLLRFRVLELWGRARALCDRLPKEQRTVRVQVSPEISAKSGA